MASVCGLPIVTEVTSAKKVDAEETDQPSRSGGSACVTEGPFRGVPETLIFKKIDRVLDPVRGVVSITFTSRRSEAETTGRGEMPAGSLHRPMVSVGSNEPSMKRPRRIKTLPKIE